MVEAFPCTCRSPGAARRVMDLLDWITAVATVVLVYAALRYPLYPPGWNGREDKRS